MLNVKGTMMAPNKTQVNIQTMNRRPPFKSTCSVFVILLPSNTSNNHTPKVNEAEKTINSMKYRTLFFKANLPLSVLNLPSYFEI